MKPLLTCAPLTGRFALVWLFRRILTTLVRGPTATEESDSDTDYTPPQSPDVERAAQSGCVDYELVSTWQYTHLVHQEQIRPAWKATATRSSCP